MAESNKDPQIVKEGWLQKRGEIIDKDSNFNFLTLGEYIKNWRSRWFVLYSDGTFRGFKAMTPGGTGAQQDALNNFKIDGMSQFSHSSSSFSLSLSLSTASAHILANDKIKKNAFVVR